MGTPGGGRRVALGNLFFKLAGCIVFSLALPLVLQGIAQLDADPRRQVLHFHVIFNLALALGFLFFTDADRPPHGEVVPRGPRHRARWRPSPGTSTPAPWRRRRWRSPTPPARRCGSATPSSRCSTA